MTDLDDPLALPSASLGAAAEWRAERARGERVAGATATPKRRAAAAIEGVLAHEVGPREAPEPVGAPGEGETPPKPVNFTPRPFVWRDPATIPRRKFIYGKHLSRGTVSATIARGGLGKSSLKLVDAVAMATGRDLLGDKPVAPLRVWYVNLEDEREEIERRVAAILLHYRIDPADIGDRLFIDGRDTCEICIATQTKAGVTIAKPVTDGLTAALIAGRFDALMIDPFVSSHRVPENDNGAIDAVVKSFARIASAANVAVELVHHSRKTNGAEITSEDSRGGSATVSAARSVRVLNRLDKDEAKKLGVDEKTRRRTFRLDGDKVNLAPPEEARWHQLVSVGLGNGGPGEQDLVGVVDKWRLPNAFDDVTTADLRAVQTKVAAGSYRESSQSREWVGYAIGETLDLDMTNESNVAKVKSLFATWRRSQMFKVVERQDKNRENRKFVEVDQWANN